MLAWPFVRILKHSSTTLVDHKSPPFANSEALQGRCVWHQEKGGAPRTRGSGLSGGSHAVSAPGSGFLFGMKAGLRREGQVLARLSRYRFGAPSNLGHVMFHLYYAVVCLLSLAPNQPNLCCKRGHQLNCCFEHRRLFAQPSPSLDMVDWGPVRTRAGRGDCSRTNESKVQARGRGHPCVPQAGSKPARSYRYLCKLKERSHKRCVCSFCASVLFVPSHCLHATL